MNLRESIPLRDPMQRREPPRDFPESEQPEDFRGCRALALLVAAMWACALAVYFTCR